MRIAALALILAACGPKTGTGSGSGTGTASGTETGTGAGTETETETEQIAVIEKAMNDLAPAASACWALAATDDYQLAGDLTLMIDIDDAGASTVTVAADSTRDPVLSSCVRDVVLAYRWPPVMNDSATQLPFAFTAPSGQFVIDRAMIAEPASGARVLLDGKNTGNRAASMFELIVPAGTTMAATASDRTEVWFALSGPNAGNATFLPPRAARAPGAPADAPLRVLVVSVPGGDEDATRSAAVLPASPANLKDKSRPKAKLIKPADITPIARTGGSVRILIEQATTGSDALSASLLSFDAGAVIPPHVHDGSTELLYVRQGRATMVVDGVTLEVGPTSVVQIPAGVEHSANISEAFEAIQLYTPAGPEQRFKSK